MFENFEFNILAKDQLSSARTGIIKTPNGIIETPAFVTCATKAAIKAVDTSTAIECGCQAIFVNTYHLMVNNGYKVIKDLNGVHKFMNWNKVVFTDSGGFQIFSLGSNCEEKKIFKNIDTYEIKGRQKNISNLKIKEEGVYFKSHIDGTTHLLTPELSMQIQKAIGSDIVLVLDECTSSMVSEEYTRQSTLLSHRWAERSLKEFERLNSIDHSQAIYGIIQGGEYLELRKYSCEFNNKRNFFGNAIGGSLGKSKNTMHEIIKYTCSLLDPKKPRHLLGIGTINEVVNVLKHSAIDTFDCVHPTRIARHGCAISPASLVPSGRINLSNARFKNDYSPLVIDCECYVCKNFTKAYIHYLLKNKEIIASQLLTTHNLFQMNLLMKEIRHAIHNNSFHEIEKKWLTDSLCHDI